MRVTNELIRVLYYAAFFILGSSAVDSNGCGKKSNEFALPAGSIEDGKISFVGLNCNSCHSVADIEWEGVEGQDLHLKLGGSVANIKTYEDLITSIINPSHKIARDFVIQTQGRTKVSPMSNYNDIMTVQELIDIVTFLQQQYTFEIPAPLYESW